MLSQGFPELQGNMLGIFPMGQQPAPGESVDHPKSLPGCRAVSAVLQELLSTAAWLAAEGICSSRAWMTIYERGRLHTAGFAVGLHRRSCTENIKCTGRLQSSTAGLCEDKTSQRFVSRARQKALLGEGGQNQRGCEHLTPPLPQPTCRGCEEGVGAGSCSPLPAGHCPLLLL